MSPLTVEKYAAPLRMKKWGPRMREDDGLKANIPKIVVAFVRQRLLAHAGTPCSLSRGDAQLLTLSGDIANKNIFPESA
jgi:hypothetical protein